MNWTLNASMQTRKKVDLLYMKEGKHKMQRETSKNWVLLMNALLSLRKLFSFQRTAEVLSFRLCISYTGRKFLLSIFFFFEFGDPGIRTQYLMESNIKLPSCLLIYIDLNSYSINNTTLSFSNTLSLSTFALR